MLVHRNGWLHLVCLMLSVWTLWGCQAQRSIEDLYNESDEEMLARTARERMLHRRAIVEVKGGATIPLDPDFEVGSTVGVKGEMEVFKNLYLGLEFDYVNQGVETTIDDILQDFVAGSPAAENAARSAEPEQWFEEFDRYNILFLFDYDVPLWDSDRAAMFRFGVGLGAVIVTGDTVSTAFADEIDSRVFGQFLARPSVGFRIPIVENLLFFTEASLDLVPEDTLTIDGRLVGGRRTKFDDDVTFSTFNIGGGLSVTW